MSLVLGNFSKWGGCGIIHLCCGRTFSDDSKRAFNNGKKRHFLRLYRLSAPENTSRYFISHCTRTYIIKAGILPMSAGTINKYLHPFVPKTHTLNP